VQLHEIIPSVATCIVSKQLCGRPEHDNHWALRDFAARLMAQICKTYTTSTNNVQTRITHVFCQALKQEKSPLSSVYGSITGLAELGNEVIKAFIIPRIKDIGARLEVCIEGVGHTQAEKTSAQKIETLIAVSCQRY
jgi:transcription initiation factor TFIID subunit 6